MTSGVFGLTLDHLRLLSHLHKIIYMKAALDRKSSLSRCQTILLIRFYTLRNNNSLYEDCGSPVRRWAGANWTRRSLRAAEFQANLSGMIDMKVWSKMRQIMRWNVCVEWLSHLCSGKHSRWKLQQALHLNLHGGQRLLEDGQRLKYRNNNKPHELD